MLIDDYLHDNDGMDSSVDHSSIASIHYDNADIDLSDDGDSFIDEVMDEYHGKKDDITFHGRDTLPPNADSDGYIPRGNQELTSTVSDIHKTFKLYSKNGHDYVLYNGKYYQIDGSGTVTIGGIKYDKITKC